MWEVWDDICGNVGWRSSQTFGQHSDRIAAPFATVFTIIVAILGEVRDRIPKEQDMTLQGKV